MNIDYDMSIDYELPKWNWDDYELPTWDFDDDVNIDHEWPTWDDDYEWPTWDDNDWPTWDFDDLELWNDSDWRWMVGPVRSIDTDSGDGCTEQAATRADGA